MHIIQKIEHYHPKTSTDIWKVFQRSYQIEADLVGVEDFLPLKRTARDLERSGTEFYGIWKEEILAAAIEIEFTPPQLEICSLVVDPDFFRQGMARQLMAFVLNKFRPKLCVVETAAMNRPAITLYSSKGFVLAEKWMAPFRIEKVKLIRVSKN